MVRGRCAVAGWDLGRPPIEQRWLGMDRRLLLPTLAVFATVLVLAGVIPAIDESMHAGEFEPGETLTVSNQLEFDAVAGWFPGGAPMPSSPTLEIFKGGVTMTIRVGGWKGSSDDLLDELLEESDYYEKGDRESFTLPSGPMGTAIRIYGIETDGAMFAIVDPDTPYFLDQAGSPRGVGVRIAVVGPPEELHRREVAEDAGRMMATMRLRAAGDETDETQGADS